MGKNEWIDDAFDMAKDESDRLMDAEKFTDWYMEKFSHRLLDGWVKTLHPMNALTFARLMMDEKIAAALAHLCSCFLMSGYMCGKYGDDEHN